MKEKVRLITLDPGTTVTFVAELSSPNLPQVYLWESDSYKDRVNGLTLYKGIIIGIAGLLALFLTIVFVVKGALIFPAPPESTAQPSSRASRASSRDNLVFPIPASPARTTKRLSPRRAASRASSRTPSSWL